MLATATFSPIGSFVRRHWIALTLIAAVIIAVIWIAARILSFAESELARLWPPENLKTVEDLLRKESAGRLADVGETPTAVLFVPKSEVQSRALESLSALEGVSDATVEIRDGYILARASISHRAQGPDATQPEFELRGTFDAAIAPYVDERQRLHFRIVLTQVENLLVDGTAVESVPEAVREFLLAELVKRLDQLNGVYNGECTKAPEDQVVSVPSCVLDLPTSLPIRLDAVESLGDDPNTVSVDGEPVILPYTIDASATLVSRSGLYVLVRGHLLDDASWSPPAQLPPADLSLPKVAEIFDATARQHLGSDYRNRVGLAFSNELISKSLASVAAKSNLNVTQTFKSPKEEFDTEVRLAERPSFKCNRSSCSRDQCRPARCEIKEEERCEVIKAGGDLARLANELTKVVCRVVEITVCEPANAANNLVCNAVADLDQGSCHIFEELKAGGCEANFAFVDKVLGRVGYVYGDYNVSGRYVINLVEASASAGLRELSVSANIGAAARAHGNLKFRPVDHGHIVACVAKWSEPFNVSVEIPNEFRRLTAKLQNQRVSAGNLVLNYKLDKFSVSGQVTPSPFHAVFTQHPHLKINCPLVSTIGDLASLINVVAPENDILGDDLNSAVSGRVEEDVSDAQFDIEIPGTTLPIGGAEFVLTPRLTEHMIVFSS